MTAKVYYVVCCRYELYHIIHVHIPDSAVVALISAKGPRSTVIAATLNVYCVKASSPSTVIEVATEESLKTVTAEGSDGW